MQIVFFVSAIVAIISTILVITRLNAIHALLYFIVSLLAVALIFFTLGAPFIAALEVIIYAGAITWILYKVIDAWIGIRVDKKDELVGLDRRQLRSLRCERRIGIRTAVGFREPFLARELVTEPARDCAGSSHPGRQRPAARR